MRWRRKKASGPGQGQRFHSKWARYDRGHLHAACWPLDLAARCAICLRRPEEKTLWYQSKSEALVAYELDRQLAVGQIIAWRRAERVTLVKAIPATPQARTQRAITYEPDFVVTLLDRTDEVWEVKGSLGTIAEDAWLKIKMFRAQDPRPLRVVEKHGRTLHA